MNPNSKYYLIGGGIGSMAAAAFMIRDGGVSGDNICILEAATLMGGSLDGAGDAQRGYSLRGGRMLTTDNYECTWDLFKTIPSLTSADVSVFEETVRFNEMHQANSQARLVDRRRAKVPVTSMGFSMQDRMELLKLSQADEEVLGASAITDHLSPEFFETEFWFMWSTTFAFQPWHSAVEFKRYLLRFMMEFTRIETLAGVKRTIYNQFDSLVLPLQKWLKAQGVHLVTGCKVTNLTNQASEGEYVVTSIQYLRAGTSVVITVHDGDLVFLQNGSMTDASSLGSMTSAPERLTKSDCNGWALWEKLAEGRPHFGNPATFNRCIAQSNWESFTVTLKNPAFFEMMNQLGGNEAGTGGLVTFKDSNWMMSIVLAHQPHFINQAADVQVFWGYALFPDRIGNFVAKPMSECNGAEILQELCGHLRFDLEVVATANCIPCMMPYITSMFMPRQHNDRPLPVPPGSKNFAFISQFVEIGKVLDGGAVGEVIDSRSSKFEAGDVVTSRYGWREAFIATPEELHGVDKAVQPRSVYLGTLGMTGMTAWAGLTMVEVKAGDVIYISGAAGAVGNMAGQLAKLRGCRVIGSAGSEEKVKRLLEECVFDAAFNYKTGPVLDQLNLAAPDGIDVYFDNVGGESLEAALSALRVHGRIIACGGISGYNDEKPKPGPSNLFNMTTKRLTMKGLIVGDWLDRQSEFEKEVGGHFRFSKLKSLETVVDGLDQAVAAFIGLFDGKNVGKMVVKLT